MDQIRAEVAKWTPVEVERVTGVPGEQLRKVAELLANNRPSTLIWCMGGDPAHGRHRQCAGAEHPAAGTGQHRVAGAARTSSAATATSRAPTDFGFDVTSLPAYYGLTEGAWKHWLHGLASITSG